MNNKLLIFNILIKIIAVFPGRLHSACSDGALYAGEIVRKNLKLLLFILILLNSGKLLYGQPCNTTIIDSSCNFTVTISNDIEKPTDTFSCSALITINDVSVSSDCGVTLLTWLMTGATNDNSLNTGINNIGTYTFNTGVTNVSYHVEDASGNFADCSFSVTVNDNQNPTITCPLNIVKPTDPALCSASITVPDPATADNCGVTLLTWAMTGATTASSPGTGINNIGTFTFNKGVTNVSYHVADAAGNFAVCSFTVTVNDNEKPIAKCKNITITLDGNNGIASISAADIDGGSTDNCSIASITASKTNFDCSDLGNNNIIFTVTDGSGNKDSCTAIVTVQYYKIPNPDASPAVDTICNGSTTNIKLSDNNLPPSATTWTWTVNPPSGILGAHNDLTGTLSYINQTLTNNTDSAKKVTYLVTPKLYGTCDQISDTVVIWVEPTSVVNFSPKFDTICNNTNVSIQLNSVSVPTTPVQFKYVTQVPAGVTVTPANGTALSNGQILTNNIVNTNNSAQLVKFIVTPYSREAGSQIEKCAGINDTAYVWVEPTSVVTFSPKFDTICNNTNVSIQLNSISVPTTPVQFKYVTQVPAGVTVTPANGTALSNGYILTNNIVNTNNSAQLVKFIVTPYSRQAGSQNEKCAGINDTAYVWVEPTTVVNFSPKFDSICNNTNVSIQLNSVSVPTTPVQFKYVTQVPAGVNVTPANGTALSNGQILTNNIVNTNNSAQLVKFIVTPYSRKAGSQIEKCAGINDTAYVWVEPTVTIIANGDTLCNNTSTSITPSSSNITINGIKYTWTVSNPSNKISGFVNDSTGVPIGNTISQKLTNSDTLVHYVKYSITPYAVKGNGSLSCPGTMIAVTINVNPTPRIRIGLSKGLSTSLDTICYNQGTNLLLTTPNTKVIGKVKYTLTTFSTSDSISGIALPGLYPIEDLPQTNLVNHSHFIQTVTYILTPEIDSVKNMSSCGNGIPDTVRLSIVPNIIFSLRSKTYIGGWNISCYGSSDGDLQIINPEGGASNQYKFKWYPGSDIDSIYNIKAGSYSVIVTDHLGCYSSKDTILTQPKPLNPVYITKNLGCSGVNTGSVTLINLNNMGGTPGYHFQWQSTKFFAATDSPSIKVNIASTYYLTVTDTNKCVDSTLYYTIYDGSIIPIFKQYDISCFGKSDGGLNVEINTRTDRAKSFTWTWPGDTAYTATIKGLKTGTYKLRIVDTAGCILDTSCYLPQPDTIHFTANAKVYPGGYNLQCNGEDDGTITIGTVTGGPDKNYHYHWSTTNGTGLIADDTLKIQNVLSAGTYKLYVTDTVCMSNDTASYTLTQPPPLKVDSFLPKTNGYNIACNGGNTGIIELSATGGYGVYTYSWSDSLGGEGIVQGDSIQKTLSAGRYKVIVYYGDNVCPTGPYLFNLHAPSPITIKPDNQFFTPVLNCYNDSNGSVEVLVTGGIQPFNGYYYHWTTLDGSTLNPSDSSGITKLKTGRYTVNVTDSNKCSVDTSFIISQPDSLTINLLPYNVSCTSGKDDGRIIAEVSGGTSPYAFNWYQNGLLMTNYKDSDLTSISAGKYEVIVSDSHGCGPDTSPSIIIAKRSLGIESLLSNYNRFNVSCHGYSDGWDSTTIIGGTAPYSYRWYKDTTAEFIDTMAKLTNAMAVTYFVKVSDKYGCSGDTSVTLNQPDSLEMSFSSQDLQCSGDSTGSITVNAKGGTPPYSYNWSNKNVTDENINLKAGWYTLVLTDANACTARDSDTITQPLPITVKNDPIFTQEPFCPDALNGEIDLDVHGGVGAYSFYWLNVQGNPQTSKLPGMGTGVYFCEIQDANKCIKIDTVKLTPKSPLCLNIPNVFSPNGDGVNDKWIITTEDPTASDGQLNYLYPDLIVEVYSRWGTLLFRSEPGYTNPWDGTYNGIPLPIDSYFYVITPRSGEGTMCGNVTIIK